MHPGLQRSDTCGTVGPSGYSERATMSRHNMNIFNPSGAPPADEPMGRPYGLRYQQAALSLIHRGRGQ